MYIEKRIITKYIIFVTKVKCYYLNHEQAKRKRGIRRFATGESKQERNRRASYNRKKYLMHNNFDLGDMWLTLTYDNGKMPSRAEEAHKNLTNVLSKIQKVLKRQNIPFVYFAKTEAGERVRVHHHLLIRKNFAVTDVIYNYWKEYGSIAKFREVYSMEDGVLVNYILNGGNHKDINFEKYAHSRNLKEPEVETRILPAKNFKENPKPPKCEDEGEEYIIQNLFNSYPDLDGYVTQEYEIVKRKINKESELMATSLKCRQRRMKRGEIGSVSQREANEES